jgi:hypothetical protein
MAETPGVGDTGRPLGGRRKKLVPIRNNPVVSPYDSGDQPPTSGGGPE